MPGFRVTKQQHFSSFPRPKKSTNLGCQKVVFCRISYNGGLGMEGLKRFLGSKLHRSKNELAVRNKGNQVGALFVWRAVFRKSLMRFNYSRPKCGHSWRERLNVGAGQPGVFRARRGRNSVGAKPNNGAQIKAGINRLSISHLVRSWRIVFQMCVIRWWSPANDLQMC